jgi:hypothetical protein
MTAQSILMLANQSGGLMDRRVAHENLLRTIGKSDAEIQALMPPPPQAQPSDPVTEFQMVMQGLPLKVGPAQDDLAHIQAHDMQLTTPGLDKTPMFAQLMAHRAEHIGGYYRKSLMAMGMQFPPPGQPVPPQIENQIAAMVAKASDALREKLAMIAPPEQGRAEVFAKVKADMTKAQVSEADSRRKNEQSARNVQADMIKLQQQMADNAAQRQHDARLAALSLQETALKTRADLTNTMLDHKADVMETRHDTARTLMEHHANIDTNRANVRVAEAGVRSAEAQARKAQATAKRQAAGKK